MAITTTYVKEFKRGGFPALGSKVGLIEVDDIDISAAVAGDSFDLFTVEATAVVLAAGVEVKTATTNASTIDVGIKGGTTDVFATGLAGNSTGEKNEPAAGQNLVNAGETVQCSVEDLDAGGTGVIRVWAVVADCGDLNGDA